jgi:alpha-D-xyloside xylohydrolase
MFSSHARAHGAPPREPWRYDSRTEAIYRRYAELRYRLLPYLYSQAVEAAQRSLPMLRALVLEYQNDPNVATIEDQYLFGDSMLVAPILTPTNRRRVYLPAGTWVDFWTKRATTGGCWIEVEAPLETLPLWVAGGAILPMGPAQQYVDEKLLDPLTVELYAPAEEGRFTIYDQGRTPIDLSYRRLGSELRVAIGQTIGRVELVWYGLAAQIVEVDGTATLIESVGPGQGVRFDGRTGAHSVRIHL